jgi:hypothetical protein
LADEPVAYLADSELTTLYERFFRRETRALHVEQLKLRALTGDQDAEVLVLA